MARSDGDKKQLFDLMSIFATMRNLGRFEEWLSFTLAALWVNLQPPVIREQFCLLFNGIVGSGRGPWKRVFLVTSGGFHAGNRSP